MKRSEQIKQNQEWYKIRGIDFDTLIEKEKEVEEKELANQQL